MALENTASHLLSDGQPQTGLITLLDLPNEIHSQIAELLLPCGNINLSQTCIVLRNIYQVLCYKDCSLRVPNPNPAPLLFLHTAGVV